MEEVDDGFEFSPGEAIQSLTIWLTPVGRSSVCRGLKLGQVTVILIETSDSRNMKFCLSLDESRPREMLVDQYQSDPECGEDLNAISWVLNSRCDRIRAVVSTNTERRPEILVPEQGYPPYDQIRRLYFMRANSDGSSDTINSIKAFIQDQAIIGIVYVYRSGKTAKLGEVNTNTSQRIEIPLDSQVVGLSIVVDESRLRKIEIELQSSGQPMTSKLCLPSDSPHYPVEEIVRQQIWCRDGSSTESYKSHLPSNHIFKPPKNSTLVGVYFGCHDITDIGAIYQPDGSVEE
ncbi:hypothetical protein N7528_004646 [Penicillium herquei]|nr:hypothetical protein N7528_004646 [Penicillium herquei]